MTVLRMQVDVHGAVTRGITSAAFINTITDCRRDIIVFGLFFFSDNRHPLFVKDDLELIPTPPCTGADTIFAD